MVVGCILEPELIQLALFLQTLHGALTMHSQRLVDRQVTFESLHHFQAHLGSNTNLSVAESRTEKKTPMNHKGDQRQLTHRTVSEWGAFVYTRCRATVTAPLTQNAVPAFPVRTPDELVGLRRVARAEVDVVPFELFPGPVGHVAKVVRLGDPA